MTDDLSAASPDRSMADLRFPIDVRIPSDVRYIERVVGVVTRRCAEESFPRQFCTLNVPVALTEAISNAILYGNRADRSKAVHVRACMNDRALVLEVRDEGKGFDLDACTIDPTSAENLDREDGRGLFLMQRLMSRVERFSDGGNVVRLTLNRE